MYDVACLGILVTDVVARTVDELPEKGKLKAIDGISMHIGGCASNACVDLAKIGLNAVVIGNVGDDSFGEFLINSLKKENVKSLGELMSRLSERDRNLLYNKYIFELSDKEISELMGIPVNNIRQYLVRARKRAIKLLNNEYDLLKSED